MSEQIEIQKAKELLQIAGFKVAQKGKKRAGPRLNNEGSKVTNVPGWGNIFNSNLQRPCFALSIKLNRYVSQAEAAAIIAEGAD